MGPTKTWSGGLRPWRGSSSNFRHRHRRGGSFWSWGSSSGAGRGGSATTTTLSIMALHLQQEWAMWLSMCLLTAASLACLYKSSTFSTPAPQVVLVVGRLLPVPLRPLAGDVVWIGLTALWLSRHVWMRLIVLRDDVRSWRPHGEYGGSGGGGINGGGGGVGGWLFLTPPFVRRHLLAGGPYLDPPHAVAYPVNSTLSLGQSQTKTTNQNSSNNNSSNRNTTTTTALSTALLGGGRAMLFPHLAAIRRKKSPRRDFWSLLIDGIDTYVLDVVVNCGKRLMSAVWPNMSSSFSRNGQASHLNHRRTGGIEDDDDWGDYVLTGSNHHGKGRGSSKGSGASTNSTSAASASSSSSASSSVASTPLEDSRPRILARMVDRIHRWEKSGGSPPGSSSGSGGSASTTLSRWLSPPPPHRIISLLTLAGIGYGLYKFHNDSFVFPFRRSPTTPAAPAYTYLGGELPSIQVVGHIHTANAKRPPPVQHPQSQLGALAFWAHDGGDNAPSSLLPEAPPTHSSSSSAPAAAPFFGNGDWMTGWGSLLGGSGNGRTKRSRSSSVLPFARTRPYGGTGVPSWGRVLFHMIWVSLLLTILLQGRLFAPIADLTTVPQATRMAWAELQRYRIANSILSATGTSATTTTTATPTTNMSAQSSSTNTGLNQMSSSGGGAAGNAHSFGGSSGKTSRLNRGSRDYSNTAWNSDYGARGHSLQNASRLSAATAGGGNIPVSASATATNTTFAASPASTTATTTTTNNNSTNLVESPEERLQLYAQIALLRIVENVLLCAWLPQTELACRATGHCEGLTTLLGEVHGVTGIAGRRDVGTMYQSLVGDRTASFVVALSVVLITELLVASQALTLDRSRLALGAYLRGPIHNKNPTNDGEEGNRSNNNNTTMVDGAQFMVDEFRNVAREGLANEVGHLSASQGMTLATTLHATHVILVGALWAYYWLMGHNVMAMSFTWLASVVAFYGTATAGLHPTKEWQSMAHQLSRPMELEAERKRRYFQNE